ncbi:LysR substrate-binding domain-containing protein [Mesorhizobium sp. YR577]|uniref:LysR substrate-binding domain-containing protein n=1 Tax=Mesorhizobium sp. YR577 TaxID=1884373 RepID=UPI0008EBEF79|nr:LysR substrate-binding domain-containing protein [Mesorhizobium sp. YR577]SFU22389.1 DNA-binding transcriptional regulator, LysR family [Mesorhizobium sp. YR577]
MRKFNVRQVEAFRAVVTMGSMSKAAELLGISQPAVSRLISDFQDAVGFKLFRRLRNGAEPTKDAKHLFEQVEKLFVGLEELNHEVAAIKNLQIGRLTIAATSSYASGFLPDLIAGFRAQYPDVNISLKTLGHEQVVDWVASGAADVGFTTQSNGNTALNTQTLRKGSVICVIHKDHPLAAKEKLRPQDLANEPFISFPRGAPFRFEIDMLFDRLGVDRTMTIDATSHDSVCGLVAAGLGIGMVNPFSPNVGRADKLVFRPISPSAQIELQMIWADASESAAADKFRAFVPDFLKAHKMNDA